MAEISNTADIIDSRDVIERIDELKAEFQENTKHDENPEGDNPDDYAVMGLDDWSVGLGWGDAEEIVALLDLTAVARDCTTEWESGATLIRDSYFEEYAQELAESIGAISRETSWPLQHIDWEAAAEALQYDYAEVNFDGVKFWVRSA